MLFTLRSQLVALSDDLAIRFTRYSANMVNQKIYFQIIGNYQDFNYNMELRGSDDLGNPVVFYMSSLREGDGIFKVDTSENGYIDEEAEKLVLPLYTAAMPLTDGRQNSTFELFEGDGINNKAGQEIIIDIIK